MPLHDHITMMPGQRRTRAGFLAAWSSMIVCELNTLRLPDRYHAEPQVLAGAGSTAFSDEEDPVKEWPPPLTAQVEFGTLDIYEVRIYDDEDLRTIVAAIELVSPANKDRPAHRRAFATKCAAYLQQGVSVVIVDIIEERRQSLHEELLRRLELDDSLTAFSAELYAVAYRTAGRGARMRLEAWPHPLAVGVNLPMLPLWLSPDLAVPLDLEATYAATCSSLKMTA